MNKEAISQIVSLSKDTWLNGFHSCESLHRLTPSQEDELIEWMQAYISTQDSFVPDKLKELMSQIKPK
jgi:hypothetical protein